MKQYTPKLKQLLVFDRVSEAIQIFCANSSIDEVIINMKYKMVWWLINPWILFGENNPVIITHDQQVYNTRFLDIVQFVNKTLHDSLERLTPDGGVRIWNIFLPKPDVPPAIAANYRNVKVTENDSNLKKTSIKNHWMWHKWYEFRLMPFGVF